MKQALVNWNGMRSPRHAWALLALIGCLPAVSVEAQAAPAANPPCASSGGSSAPSSKPCALVPAGAAPTSSAPSVSQKFPYPGDTGEAGSPENPGADGLAAKPRVPEQDRSTPNGPPPAGAAPTSPQSAFPYPGDPDAPGASSSSSSSSGAGSSDPLPGLDDVGSEGTETRRRLPKVTKLQNDEDRAYEDLTVAKFYQDKGNLNAAYLRSKDAVKVQPQLPDAHLALAQIADKLQKRDEAAAEFATYLKLEPDGDGSKIAHKALNRLK